MRISLVAAGVSMAVLAGAAPVLHVAAAASPPAAASVNIGALSIEGATIPETPGGMGAAYFTIVNGGRESDWVTAASADVAQSVEFHTMVDEGGTMQMRPMQDVVIPPGAALTFAPGGNHLMLIGLAKPLRAGDTVTLKITFDRHGEMTVPIVVTPRAAGGEHSGHH
ncbi:MAG: copper chaperone PCu(A)C [Alphaproteobacteria bacterium]|nr:copper chaperone PCu(A)C [Alphaproteobacteria bacterium]